MSESRALKSAGIDVIGLVWVLGSTLATGCGSVTVSNPSSDSTGAFGGSSGSDAPTTVGGSAAVGGTYATNVGLHSGGAVPGGSTSLGMMGGSSGGGTRTDGATASTLTAGVGSLGGTRNMGGNDTLAGGSNPTGGALATGGWRATGGSLPVNETAAIGGATRSMGGIASIGGTWSTGGALAAGGVVTTGGASSTGGALPAGGSSNTGGVTSVPMPVLAVAAGFRHTCAVMSDHTVRCWGNSCNGQLGDGRTFDCASEVDVIETPVKVSSISEAVSIAAGALHTCVVLSTGKIQCWGVNYHGELGDGTRTDSAVPVDVVGISTARAVVAGDRHTCALLADGTVRCWGPNDVGQLGSGAKTSNVDLTLIPVTVVIDTATPPTPLGNVESITSGSIADSTCAVQVGGKLYCWGDNEYGQLLGVTSSYSNIALAAEGITVGAVDVGRKTTCALLASGTVSCWGEGDSGELGDGLQQNSRTPATVALSSAATALTLGSSHGCAILGDADRGLQCWGDNLYGQLGDGTGFNDLASPVSVKDLSNVTQVNASHGHTCAIVESGALYCWGDDYDGQCGPNASRNHVNGVGTTPVIVTGF